MKFIKRNWFKIIMALLLVLILTGAFYWYELRPDSIRKDCSWFNVVSSGYSGKSAWTQEELDKCKRDRSTELGSYYCDLEGRGVSPTVAKDYWREASQDEYNSCLHQNGL